MPAKPLEEDPELHEQKKEQVIVFSMVCSLYVVFFFW